MALAETVTTAHAISLASAEVGYREGQDAYGHWNNVEKYAAEVPGLAWVSTGGYAWCDVFANWVLYKVGALGRFVPTASVINSLDQAQKLGRFTEYPVVGGQVIYGRQDHTGICIRYDDTYLWAIEGNAADNGSSTEGDGVYLKQRLRRDPWVTGYTLPYYNERANTPDTTWKGKWLGLGPETNNPAPAPKPVPVVVATHVAVSLSAVRSAAQHDPGRPQGGVTPGAADDVRIVEALLVKAHLLDPRYANDGSFGSLTRTAYANWQKSLGYRGSDADGVPGSVSLSKLLAKFGGGKYVLAK